MNDSVKSKVHTCKCLAPVDAWRCGYTFAKRDGVISPRLVFSRQTAANYYLSTGVHLNNLNATLDEHYNPVPCGHCMACQMTKRRDMTVRLSHESRMHDSCCFITLTYDNANVPTTDDDDINSSSKLYSRGSYSPDLQNLRVVNGNTILDDFIADDDSPFELPNKTLFPVDVQLFLKRLRRHLEYVPKGCSVKNGKVFDRDGNFVRDHNSHLRYYAVGEYGTRTKRPHYHIMIFGWIPSDCEFFKTIKNNLYYTSPQLSKLWRYGYHTIGSVTPAVAKYCARYVTKKYARLNSKSATNVIPEFTLQSVRDGGIGATWFDEFGEHACRTGRANVMVDNRVIGYSVPSYYYSRLRKTNLPLWLELRDQRIAFIKTHDTSVDLGSLIRTCEVQKEKDLVAATLELI